MSRNQFAQRLYSSYAWQRCRAEKLKRTGGLCERCLARGLIVPGVEVHHKIHLTPENFTDPEIALNLENLEVLCAACHRDEHARENDSKFPRAEKMRTDFFGRVEI
jgi:5-methylcytosine-specific restriction endonuclease McrA